MKYEYLYTEGFPTGTYVLLGTDPDGKTWGIPEDESNSMYQQYLVDTDGGLPLPKGAK